LSRRNGPAAIAVHLIRGSARFADGITPNVASGLCVLENQKEPFAGLVALAIFGGMGAAH